MTKRRKPRGPARPAADSGPEAAEHEPEPPEAAVAEAAVVAAALPNARFGAGSGVVFALLSFLASSLLAVGDVEPQDPAADIAARLVETRGRIGLGVILTLLSLFFLLVFVSYLHRWLRTLEGEGGWLANLAFAGGLLVVVTLLVGLLIGFAGTVLDDYGEDPEIARTLLVLGWRSVIITLVPMAALVGATAAVGGRTGGLPRWLSTSGLVLAGGLLVIPVAFIPFLFSTLWIGMVAVTLLTRARAGGGRRRA